MIDEIKLGGGSYKCNKCGVTHFGSTQHICKRMSRTITEAPDKWVILKLPGDYYKVFGSWAGGYLDGDSWKLNSGIERVEQDDYYYYFIGFSGSCYKCHKRGYGTATSYVHNILNKIIEDVRVELMFNIDDWTIINNKETT